MKKFTLYRRHFLLKCWLLAIACHSGSCLHLTASYEDYPMPAPDQEAWLPISSEQDFIMEFDSEQVWKHPENRAVYHEKPYYDPAYIDRPSDHVESSSSYSTQDDYSDFTPPASNFHYEHGNLAHPTSNHDSYPIQQDYASPETTSYYNEWPVEPSAPLTTFSDSPSKEIERSYQLVETVFDSNQTLEASHSSISEHHPNIPESGQAASYPFEDSQTAGSSYSQSTSDASKIATPSIHVTEFKDTKESDQAASSMDQPLESSPLNQTAKEMPGAQAEKSMSDLTQGKGNIKIIKKLEHSSEQKILTTDQKSSSFVGKQSIADPAVGFVTDAIQASSADESIFGQEHGLDQQAAHSIGGKPSWSTKKKAAFMMASKKNAQLEGEGQAGDADLIAQTGRPAEETINTTSPLTQTRVPLPILTPAQPPRAVPPAVESRPASVTTTRTQSVATPPGAPIAIPPSDRSVNEPGRRAPMAPMLQEANTTPGTAHTLKEISINFNNVAMIEYIRFISRISNKNFIFDDEDLQFNVTIVSEEPTSVENLMAALLQELRIRDLLLIEQGNNLIIHRNPRVRAPSRIVADGTDPSTFETELVTRVFRLNTLDPLKASEIIRPLLSDDAIIEVLRDSNNLIITDLVTNVNKIAQLISSLDAPNSGVTVGQYVVRNAFVASLADLATKILQPIAQGNPFVLVPHSSTNSIFIVSNPFIVERALAILENLDINEGRTKIMTLERLRLEDQPERQPGLTPGSFGQPGSMGPGGIGPGGVGPGGPGATGIGSGGIGTGGIAGPGGVVPGTFGPDGFATPLRPGDSMGSLNIPGTPTYNPNLPPRFPTGSIDIEGRQGIIFDENREFRPGGITTSPRWVQDLPAGHIERTLFFIYKLKFRRGDQIEVALRRIADSLQITGMANLDLIAAINSSQWIEATNSLIFTGTVPALERIKELILEIDIPLRQVFIEMLILDTTISDSLTYGVDWGTRFGGGETAGGQNFLGTGPGLANFLTAAATTGTVTAPPVVDGLLSGEGYSAGIIGRHLTHGGLHFSTIGALVRALHTDSKINIILNPKIVTEDNNTAEIFVGSTDRYKTQSIANDIGSVITNNFQFIDVGTTLRVTPLIGNNGIITLDIIQEVTNDSGAANPVGTNTSLVDVNLIPVLSKSRTVTRIHVPDGFFVILSGMIQGTETRATTRIPCLGGIPIIGGISKNKNNADNKRNLMIFIRPLIVDTEEELENVTKRQQDVFREKSKFRRSWNYEIDEALDFLSIRPTDPDEIGCTIK